MMRWYADRYRLTRLPQTIYSRKRRKDIGAITHLLLINSGKASQLLVRHFGGLINTNRYIS